MSVTNCVRSTKWYSRPSCSFWRGFRVVCDTLKRSSSPRSLSNAVVSVVLPAPDGDDTMSGSGPSFHILDLLPDSFELGLHLHDQMGNRGILALCANCIRFSTDFLQQKIQATPDRSICFDQPLELIEVGVEAHELFGHVAAICQNHDFCLEATGVQLNPRLGKQALQAIAEARSVALEHFSATRGNRDAEPAC